MGAPEECVRRGLCVAVRPGVRKGTAWWGEDVRTPDKKKFL